MTLCPKYTKAQSRKYSFGMADCEIKITNCLLHKQTTSSSTRRSYRYTSLYKLLAFLNMFLALCVVLYTRGDCSADRKKARNVKERWNEKRWIEMMKKKNNWLEVNIVAWQHLHDWWVCGCEYLIRRVYQNSLDLSLCVFLQFRQAT